VVLDDALELEISYAIEVGEAALKSDEAVFLYGGDIDVNYFKDT
jgi:hypothetical protein